MTNTDPREGHAEVGPATEPGAGPDAAARAALDGALTREPGRVLSVLIRALGDFDLAEDALQDAVTVALERWPADGVPGNPAGWLVTTARRRAIDRLRRSASWQRKQDDLRVLHSLEAAEKQSTDDSALGDERLRLIFTCCHPALALEARVSLTLRTVGGLGTAEVARAFLTTESTMKKRLARAKQRIRSAGIPYSVPSDELLAERIGGVLAVLYLIFNEGYVPTSGGAVSAADLGDEAIRLARLVAAQLPDPEAQALLAVMLFHNARRSARTAADGSLVLLDDQDRRLWDREAIAEGNDLLASAASWSRPGPYQLQAAIAYLHVNAPTAAETEWTQIATLYDRLLELTPTPVLALNRAVAHGMAAGPEVGLSLTDAISGLDRYHLFHATRADMLRRLGRHAEALDAYQTALVHVTNAGERAFLEHRLAQCRRAL
jgi:RNA polymerase sigma-70 factor (ECF subfamily)